MTQIQEGFRIYSPFFFQIRDRFCPVTKAEIILYPRPLSIHFRLAYFESSILEKVDRTLPFEYESHEAK